VHVAAIVAAMSLRIARSEVLTICIRVELRAIAGGLRYRLALARELANSALTCFLIGPIRCRAREQKCAAIPLVEIATITTRGLAGQPVKCGGERARLAEADVKRNGGDGQLTIRQ
jgi:hypothetical protein